jgi:hypothetical protein
VVSECTWDETRAQCVSVRETIEKKGDEMRGEKKKKKGGPEKEKVEGKKKNCQRDRLEQQVSWMILGSMGEG